MEKWEAVFAFHFSMPHISFHFPGRRRKWPVSQRRVRPGGVVVDAPPFSQQLPLLQRVNDLPVQELVPQLGVEALAIALLPGRAEFDIQRLGFGVIQPFAQYPGHELGAIGANVLSYPVLDHGLGKYFDHISAVEPAPRANRQALPGQLID